MEKSREAETSTSMATIENIQKRLIRPSLQSQPWSGRINSQISSKFTVNSTALMMKKTQETRIRKLEDYLHPVLLSTAREKISGNRKKHHGAEIKKATKCAVQEFDLFRWSGGGDHHQRFSALAGGSTAGISEVKKEEDRNDAVDLSKD
ncbi:OLC1v1034828C1 [Oldenlandia corymbosa var. corymbosa]|uniref:OLC1v1034828C1 n=1 Tax=Oldenlandia corymbosa var. corymbosa TaxID=529605 RepID=A0AAV1CUJ9_OLDCO|nr:OLC1v1034828C1 [Oldenlandia corymbosa var. corymbosa]